MRIGDKEILLPTMMVGNYPNPRWYDGQWYQKATLGQFSHDSVEKEAFEDATMALVRDQEAAGLDVISDGRICVGSSYGNVIYYYYERLGGFMPHGPNIALPIYSTLYAPTLMGPVERKYPLMVNAVKAVKKATGKPVKIQYTGVHVLTKSCVNNHYSSERELAMAIAKALNEDFKAVEDLGAEAIQMDEFVWPYGMDEWAVEAFNRAVEGIKAKVFLHICFGNYSGTPGYFPDGTADEGASYTLTKRRGAAPEGVRSVLPKALDANFGVLNIEFGRRNLSDINVLREYYSGQEIAAGVIDVKSTIAETAEEVAIRIRRFLEFVPPEKLAVTTDCGLILLQRYVATQKLKALAEGTEIVRRELRDQGRVK